jgi:hypothetical protein
MKAPNLPGSGKGIAEHQGCPSQAEIRRNIIELQAFHSAKLRPDEQKSHQVANGCKADRIFVMPFTPYKSHIASTCNVQGMAVL